jgi:hypothetical protein
MNAYVAKPIITIVQDRISQRLHGGNRLAH